MQVRKYARMHGCKYARMQECKNVIMQVCTCALVQVRKDDELVESRCGKYGTDGIGVLLDK